MPPPRPALPTPVDPPGAPAALVFRLPPTPLTQDTTMHRFTTAAAIALAAATLAACSADEPSTGTQSSEAGMGHSDGARPRSRSRPRRRHLVCRHTLRSLRVTNDGERERVADRWQDTMGFAVVGPGHFLGSGHPDLQEDLPASLGLIESTDGAETWQAVSMQGEADLHAIEPVGDRIYAYDSHTAPSSPPSTGPTGTHRHPAALRPRRQPRKPRHRLRHHRPRRPRFLN